MGDRGTGAPGRTTDENGAGCCAGADGDGRGDRATHDDLRPYLRAGVAVYNAGEYHEAHDAWEDYWLALDGGDDERLLHGLIQFTAAVHHAHDRNWAGATGLAESAGEYLADLPDEYRGVNVGAVREWLAGLRADPELVERGAPLRLTHEGEVLRPADLEFPAASVAAVVLAEAAGYDGAVFERAREYGHADLAAGTAESPFVSLVLSFVERAGGDGATAGDAGGGGDLAVVVQRLREHVRRRDARESDVEGLFE